METSYKLPDSIKFQKILDVSVENVSREELETLNETDRLYLVTDLIGKTLFILATIKEFMTSLEQWDDIHSRRPFNVSLYDFINPDILDNLKTISRILKDLVEMFGFNLVFEKIPSDYNLEKIILSETFEKALIQLAKLVQKHSKEFNSPAQTEKIKKTLQNYANLPSTALTNVLKQFINNPTRIEAPRRGQIRTEEHYLTHDTIITYKGKDGEYTISVERVKDLFAKRVQNGTKIFNFFLQKLNEQNYQENTDFLLPELIEAGIYASPDSAYRGLKTVCDKFHHIGIAGIVTSYQGRKRKEIGINKAALVSEWTVTYNKCRVVLPQIIRNSAPYITILPSWGYALPSENAYMLLDYIYYLARQNTDKIRERGYFTISLGTIRQHLGLPNPEETVRHNQFIVEPIEAAITAIEDEQESDDLKITPIYNPDYKNIHEYLDGYLEIRLSGEAFEYMEGRAIKQDKKCSETRRLENKKEIAKAAETISKKAKK